MQGGAALLGRLAGKIALITGATSGIGRTCALTFAREGAAIAATGIDPPAGASLVREIKALGGRASYVNGDVGDRGEIERIVAEVIGRFETVNIFVSNAALGTIHVGGTVETIDEDRWHRTLEVNLTASYRFCKRLIPIMRKSGGGSIILMSSYSAFRSHISRPSHAYVTSKGAVLSLMRGLAMSYAKSNIRCNAICPYLIATGMNLDLLESPQRQLEQSQAIPLGRIGQPQDVANAALFLASDESAFITGQALIIDGGLDAAIQI